ncbi:MAG: antA/AntB antirepressor family protein [Spirochaetaceae bacterium]|nr:antA/AntB antirepressor family protein [Spirochaetaceae bacterium]
MNDLDKVLSEHFNFKTTEKVEKAQNKEANLPEIIQSEDGKVAVSAKQLYEYLDVDTRFNDWIERKIQKYEFVENQDYVLVAQKRVTNNPKNPVTEFTDYAMTINMAKELSMVENNDRGRQARKYFIECEERLKHVVQEQKSVAVTPLEALKLMVEALDENDRRITIVNDKVDLLKNDVDDLKKNGISSPDDTKRIKVREYLKLKNIGYSSSQRKGIGKAIITYCKKNNVDFVPDITGAYYPVWVVEYILNTRYFNISDTSLKPVSPIENDYLSISQYATKHGIKTDVRCNEERLSNTAKGMCIASNIPISVSGKIIANGILVNTYPEYICKEAFIKRGYIH